jgi:beta-lactamase class A
MCAPQWHSGAVFSAFIGGNGADAVAPEAGGTFGWVLRAGSLIVVFDLAASCALVTFFSAKGHFRGKREAPLTVEGCRPTLSGPSVDPASAIDRIGVIISDIRATFEQAGCAGTLYVQSLDDDADVGLAADEPVIPASVVKVQIALEAQTWFADGRLDPVEPVALSAADRTFGPTGISLFDDDAVVSWRDLVVLMLTISDNHAADALLRRVGVGAVNATAARLGLTSTVVESDLRTMLDSIGQDLGRVSWADLLTWQAEASVEEVARADQRLLAVRALDPARGTRTTARDMVRLLRLIWIGRAGPAAACDRVRALMARQLTRHRIASGFRPPVKVAAKSGGLLGIVRNEIGVISYPDGRQYAAAVFTRSQPGSDDAAIAARHPARGRLGSPRGHRGVMAAQQPSAGAASGGAPFVVAVAEIVRLSTGMAGSGGAWLTRLLPCSTLTGRSSIPTTSMRWPGTGPCARWARPIRCGGCTG